MNIIKKLAIAFLTMSALLLIILVGGFFYWDANFTYRGDNKHPLIKKLEEERQIRDSEIRSKCLTESVVGDIHENVNGQMVYSNVKLGFNMVIPEGWQVQDNSLGTPPSCGGSSLSLYNYDYDNLKNRPGNPHVFGAGMNKIYVSDIFPSNNHEYPTPDQLISINIDGRDAYVSARSSVEGIHFREFYIPLINQSSSTLRFSIAGDQVNFGVLDAMINSIKWTTE